VGITLGALVLGGCPAFSFPAIPGAALGFSVGLPAIGSGAAIALSTIIALSALVHGILLAMPHPTTLEGRFRRVGVDKSFEALAHRC
jgi:hypothetical protein